LAWCILASEDDLALPRRVAQKYVTVFMKRSTKPGPVKQCIYR
jgi:hypothetical protein